MPVLFKRNSLSSMGGGGGGSGGGVPANTSSSNTNAGQSQALFGMKRPSPPSERDLVLAGRSKTQGLTLNERNRKKEIEMKHEAAAKIQRAWRRYVKRKRTTRGIMQENLIQMSRDNIRKKRLKTTQEEWERQIAALTIQLAWRKYFRRKLIAALHPNKRQLQMWDPEIVALKQQALLHYIYNEQLIAPFWHPRLKAMARPMWTRCIPSPAAVSYNFAVDQYVPWVARLGGIPFLTEEEEGESEDSSPQPPSQHKNSQHSAPSSHLSHSSNSRSSGHSDTRGNRGSRKNDKKDGAPRPKTTLVTKRASTSSNGVRTKS